MAKSTEEYARSKLVKAQSVRARLCRTGSYFGAKPKKLENGLLDWEDAEGERKTSPDGSSNNETAVPG